MSPWVDLADLRGTLKKGDPYDMMPSKTLRYWGAQSLKPVPEEYLGYIQANSASDDWWKGVDAFVDRVLITAGRDECLRDEIIRFSTVFEKFHPQVNMHEHDGIHDDPLFAVELGESAGGATDTIIDWLQTGF
jgi:acetyl esterase/lipase